MPPPPHSWRGGREAHRGVRSRSRNYRGELSSGEEGMERGKWDRALGRPREPRLPWAPVSPCPADCPLCPRRQCRDSGVKGRGWARWWQRPPDTQAKSTLGAAKPRRPCLPGSPSTPRPLRLPAGVRRSRHSGRVWRAGPSTRQL